MDEQQRKRLFLEHHVHALEHPKQLHDEIENHLFKSMDGSLSEYFTPQCKPHKRFFKIKDFFNDHFQKLIKKNPQKAFEQADKNIFNKKFFRLLMRLAFIRKQQETFDDAFWVAEEQKKKMKKKKKRLLEEMQDDQRRHKSLEKYLKALKERLRV